VGLKILFGETLLFGNHTEGGHGQ